MKLSSIALAIASCVAAPASAALRTRDVAGVADGGDAAVRAVTRSSATAAGIKVEGQEAATRWSDASGDEPLMAPWMEVPGMARRLRREWTHRQRLRRGRMHRPRRAMPGKVAYNHLPKAAGTFIDHVISAAVGKDRYALVGEFKPMAAMNETEYFTIGSMRNPCEFYVSLWAFGADGRGSFRNKIPPNLYETTSPYKNNSADVGTFRKWLKEITPPNGPGLLSMRLARSYGRRALHDKMNELPTSYDVDTLRIVNESVTNITLRDMDCWVYVEDIERGTEHCLRRWSRGSKEEVDFLAFHNAVKHSDHWSSDHGACRQYFDSQTEDFVRKVDPAAWSIWGYTDCCTSER